MDSLWARERVGRPAIHRGRGRGGRGKGPMRDRSPGQLREVSRIRRKLDGEGDDLGTNLGSIRTVIKKGMEVVVGNVPREMQAGMKKEIGVMVKTVEEVMDKISEKDRRERMERKEMERMMEEKLVQLEGKLRALEEKAEVSSTKLENRVKLLEEKLEGGMEKVKGIEELVEGVKGDVVGISKGVGEQIEEVKEHVELVSGFTLNLKIAESVKQMEEKVKEAGRALKVVNMDIGLETENKALIVRKVLWEVRRKVRQEDAGQVDRVLRRTRVVVLGRRTEGRKVGERTIWTVPILFQCLDKVDVKDLEWWLRGVGFSQRCTGQRKYWNLSIESRGKREREAQSREAGSGLGQWRLRDRSGSGWTQNSVEWADLG